jgi:hypothetical protein
MSGPPFDDRSHAAKATRIRWPLPLTDSRYERGHRNGQVPFIDVSEKFDDVHELSLAPRAIQRALVALIFDARVHGSS